VKTWFQSLLFQILNLYRYIVAPEDHEWVAALQPAPESISPSRAGRAALEKLPALLAVVGLAR
jgi:hypothetical protein